LGGIKLNNTKLNNNQITIKQSALYFLDDPIERCLDYLIGMDLIKDNGESYTRDDFREINQNIDSSFQKRGRGGSYTFTIKKEIEKIVLQEVLGAQLGYVEMLCGFGEEGADKAMEKYLWDKTKELDAIEILLEEDNSWYIDTEA